MDSRIKLLGHPVHQMLIVFPLGLLATSLVFDLIALATGLAGPAVAAYWMIPAGLVGGLVAAPFGLVDWLAIPRRTRAKTIGLYHAGTNVVVLGVFLGSWLLRDPGLAPGAAALALSVAGVVLAAIAGWFGGELVDRLGVGVSADANLDAPSSLRGRRAAAVEARRPER